MRVIQVGGPFGILGALLVLLILILLFIFLLPLFIIGVVVGALAWVLSLFRRKKQKSDHIDVTFKVRE